VTAAIPCARLRLAEGFTSIRRLTFDPLPAWIAGSERLDSEYRVDTKG
jgi:hypothetical protein